MRQLYKKLLCLSLFLLVSVSTYATHIIGGSLTYEYLGGASYRITLKMYRDCSSATGFDNPALIEIRGNNGATFATSKDISMALSTVSVVNPYIDTCAVNPNVCIEEAIYTTVVNNLPPNVGGYHLYYRRCCRNALITNLSSPLNDGFTIYTYIPDNNVVLGNSSPTWSSSPPTYVCVGKPINYNHSATDADGDSLVYSFYSPYIGCSNANPGGGGACTGNAPTYSGNVATFNSVGWAPGYGPNNPMGGANLTLSPNGLLSGTPTSQGYFVVGVMCKEYRDGVQIGYIIRDYQYIAIPCPPLAQASFTTSTSCAGQSISFTNTSDTVGATGGTVDYLWNFGDPLVTNDSSVVQNPSPYTYTGTGPFTVTLIINPRTGCADTATQVISISSVNAAYTSTDSTCVTNGITFTDGSTVASNATISSYQWSFGDPGSGGSNTSTAQNPTHTFSYGGSATQYTVSLIVTSTAGCKDTMLKTITVLGLPIVNAHDTISCSNNPAVSIAGTVLNAGGGTWSVVPAPPGFTSGAISPSANVLTPTYTPTPDEIAQGFATLVLTSTGSTLCPARTDTMQLTFTPGPTANAGTNAFVCKDTLYIPLNGSVTIATGGQWTPILGSTGSVTNSTSLSTAQYIPSAADLTNGVAFVQLQTTTGNGTCGPSYDTVSIFFNPPPTAVISGTSDSSCVPLPITVNGTSSTGTNMWTTSGDGTFADSSLATTVYTPGAADTTSGVVTLYFNTTNNGGCKTVKDSITITLLQQPTANAGADVLVCQDTVSVPLSGSVTISTTGQWSNGPGATGTINNPDSLTSATYVPSPGDILAGSATLVLTTTINGNCNQATDTVKITFGPPPTVTATSANDSSCVTQPFVVNGNSSTGSGIWTTSGDGSFASSTQDTTIYTPGVNDATAGSVTIYFNTTNNSGCRTYKDSVQITLLPAPLADAGNDTIVCLNNMVVTLNGQTALSTGSNWTILGSNPGTLSSSTALNPTYTPSPQEIAQGYAELTLTPTGLITSCPANSDTIRISYVTGPSVLAGPDAFVCKDTSYIPLNGSVTVATGGQWNVINGSSGTIINPTSLTNAQYVPSLADLAAGVAHLELQSTGNGTCVPNSDTIDIYFSNNPNVIASSGNDTSCVSLPFSVSGTSSTNAGIWTSSGDGSFADTTQSSTVYSPGVNDALSGSVTVYYNSINNGGCQSRFDSVTVIILPAPLANAGADTTSCLNSPAIQLNGSVALASGGIWTTTGASPGSFNNPNALNPVYTPSAAEITQGYADVVLTGQGLISSCPPESDTVRITFVPGPTATIQSLGDTLQVCEDTSLVNLTAAITVATGVNWTTNGTGTFNTASSMSTQYQPSAVDVSSGIVTLYVSSTGNGLCTQASDSLKLVFYAVPSLTVTSANDTACTSNVMPINAATATGAGYWTSSGNGTFLPDTTALAATYTMGSADGSQVSLVFHTTNNNGCKSQLDTLKIDIIAGPSSAFTSTIVCPGALMNFTDASTVSSGFVSGWQWDFGDAGATATGQTPSHAYPGSGSYTVTLVTTSNNGCTDTLIQPVTVYNVPVADFTIGAACLYQPAQFSDASTVAGSTITGWNWNFGNGTSTQQNPVDSFSVVSGNNVTLVVTSAQGCKDSITKSVSVLPQPVADFSADDYNALVGQQINFTDQTTPSGTAWSWNFGDNSSNALNQNPSHSYNFGGVYPVTLYVTDANGCKDTVTKEIIVALPPEVPTGFSPNGDGHNDVYYVLGGPFTECHFRIYNNWGELIFESFEQKTGWDGTYKGAPQPMGVYVWVVDATTENGDAYHKSGDVTLLR
ncbi:MAG: PKD domain-containing protein [Bacteroidia bacterium]